MIISNFSYLLPGHISHTRKAGLLSIVNNEKSACCDYFLSVNKIDIANKASFKGSIDFSKFKKVGTALLTDTEDKGENVKADILSKTKGKYNLYYVTLGDKILGYMKTEKKYGPYGISPRKDKCNYLYVLELETEGKSIYKENIYKGVGSALIKKAIEDSCNTVTKGRVQLLALNSAGFFSQFGFKYCPPPMLSDAEIEKMLLDPDNDKLQCCDMYLPEEVIKKKYPIEK